MPENHKELDWTDLKFKCDGSILKFKTTEELEYDEQIYGQDRAIRAIDFGVEIKSFGYNIYVLGPLGTGKTTAVRRALKKKAKDLPPPPDWVYVNNFDDFSIPIKLKFPTGKGVHFRNDMEKLIDELTEQIPRAFEHENYQEQRKKFISEIETERQKQLEHLAQFAAERNFELKNMGRGIVMIPIKDGQQLLPEMFEKLPDTDKTIIEQGMKEIQEETDKVMEVIHDMEEKVTLELTNLNRNIADMVVARSIGKLKKKYSQHKEAIRYLNDVKENILDTVRDFIPVQQPQEGTPMQLMAQREPDFNRFSVNLLISNREDNGSPVVFEKHPTYYNLVGRIEHRATPQGGFETDFTMIKPGSLHKANGGFLIVEINEILRNPQAYEALKRCLKNKQVIIEDLNEQFRLIATTGLRPDPIPLDVKVIMIGSPYLYYMLYTYDEDFQKLFKVKADFGYEMDLNDSTILQYANFINTIVKRENLRHFTCDAVIRVVEYSSRMVEHRKKLATSFSKVADLLREASYWASENNHDVIEESDVLRAIEEKDYRANRIEQKLQEMLEDGTIMVDTDGKVVGQVNGLAVMSFGESAFGKPSRITARHFAGKAGIVIIEREVKLSGRIHDKGTMILSSFLRSKFGSEKSLSFSASITFEQVYEEIDGDSASSTELYSLLSSLSDIPIKQSIAVTGSVNQYGQVQPIGGANYKIEGFFALCKTRGLTGEQGVMIPHQNVKNLALRDEVINAVKDGKFHIWPVETIDEGIEILTGKPAGKLKRDGTYPKNSIYGKVADRLDMLTKKEEKSTQHKRPPRASRGIKL
jgi:lon-related putative ATP-dependent protease